MGTMRRRSKHETYAHVVVSINGRRGISNLSPKQGYLEADSTYEPNRNYTYIPLRTLLGYLRGPISTVIVGY